jgi:hypothetical protein
MQEWLRGRETLIRRLSVEDSDSGSDALHGISTVPIRRQSGLNDRWLKRKTSAKKGNRSAKIEDNKGDGKSCAFHELLG